MSEKLLEPREGGGGEGEGELNFTIHALGHIPAVIEFKLVGTSGNLISIVYIKQLSSFLYFFFNLTFMYIFYSLPLYSLF